MSLTDDQRRIARELTNFRAMLVRRDGRTGASAEGEHRNLRASEDGIAGYVRALRAACIAGRMTDSQGERFLYLERWAIRGRAYADDHAARIGRIVSTRQQDSNDDRATNEHGHTPDSPARECTCPDDCNCRYAWRTNYCGCHAHPSRESA